MSSRTTFPGRLIGLCLLIPLSMAVHKQGAMEMVTALMQNRALLSVEGHERGAV